MKIEKDKLKEYIEKHPRASLENIATRFGVTRITIKKYIDKFEIIRPYNSRGRRFKIDEETFKDYLEKHPKATTKELCAHFKVCNRTIYKYMRACNIPNKRGRRDIVDKDKINAFMKKNPRSTIKEVSEYFSVSLSTASRYLREYKSRNEKKIPTEKEFKDYIDKYPKATQADLEAYFKIGKNKIRELIKQYGVSWVKKNGRKQKGNENEFKGYIMSHPYATIEEIANNLKLSERTISRRIKKYKLSGKKGKKREFTDEQIIENAINMLNSIPNLEVDTLKEFLNQKGFQISEESILNYQKNILQKTNKQERNEER